MTRRIGKRCGHCGIPYTFQASGPGSPPDNDGIYCPGCKTTRDAALREAFGKIPRLFEMRMLNIVALGTRFEDITPEQLKVWDAEEDAAKRARGDQVFARRVFAPLFNLETGDSTHTIEVKGRSEKPGVITRERPPEYVGVPFRLTYWKQRPQDFTIEVPMEYDLREGRFTDRIWRT